MTRGITATAVEVEHDRQFANACCLRWDVNEIIAGAILVLEREAVIAGCELHGGLRRRGLAIRSVEDNEKRERRQKRCAQTWSGSWPSSHWSSFLTLLSRRPLALEVLASIRAARATGDSDQAINCRRAGFRGRSRAGRRL